MLTIWSVVWIAVGRRIFGIAVISSTVANIFMPITVVFSRSRLFRSATMPAKSKVFRWGLLLHGVSLPDRRVLVAFVHDPNRITATCDAGTALLLPQAR